MSNISTTRLSGFFGGGGGGGTPTTKTLQQVTTSDNEINQGTSLILENTISNETFNVSMVDDSTDGCILNVSKTSPSQSAEVKMYNSKYDMSYNGSKIRIGLGRIEWSNDNFTTSIKLEPSPLPIIPIGTTTFLPQSSGVLGLNEYPLTEIDMFLGGVTISTNQSTSYRLYTSDIISDYTIGLDSDNIPIGTTLIFNLDTALSGGIFFSYSGSTTLTFIGYPTSGYFAREFISITRMGDIMYFSSFQI